MGRLLKRITELSLETDDIREKYQIYYTSLILAFVLTIMSVINIITSTFGLLLITLAVSLIMIVLAVYVKHGKYNKNLVSIFIILLLVFVSMWFIITGSANGFCIVWTLLMPYAITILLGTKIGSLVSAMIFSEFVFFFYIPYGNALLNYDYNTDFLIRFPIAFLTSYIIAIYLEYGRKITANALKEEKERYHELSKRDALTGVYNRQGFNEIVEKLIDEYQGKPVALLIVDIDFFKRVNDEYGHTVGDKVLQALSTKMAGMLKHNQHICRWGGEEFAILLYEEGEADNCEEIAKELLDVVENESIKIDDLAINITVSIGCAYLGRMQLEDKERLFNCADISLYEAKANGRNQAVLNIV